MTDSVKFDNFEWHSDKDPNWDEFHATVELPITNPTTGQNYIAPNLPVYSIQSLFTPATYAEYQALHPDEYAVLPYGDESITFSLEFAYTDNLGNPQVWTMPLLMDFTQYTQGHWIFARYQLNPTFIDIDPEAHLHTDYWSYLIGSNYDPILEALLTEESEGEDFLPIVILMQDTYWYDFPYGDSRVPRPDLIAGKTDLHATTDKILKKLAMKGSDIKAAFLEQEADNSNPNNNTEKWDFYLHFAASLHSKVSETAEYLFKFFQNAMPYQQYTFEDYQQYLTTGGGIHIPDPEGPSFTGLYRWYRTPQPLTTMQVTEGYVTGYDATFGWSYIAEKTFPGQYINEYASNAKEGTLLKPGQASIQLYEHKKNNIPQYRKGLDAVHSSAALIAKIGDDDTHGYHDYAIFTMQFSDSIPDSDERNYYYTRILVMGLSQEYRINTRSSPGGGGGSGEGEYKIQKVNIGMFDRDNDGTRIEAFRIPLNISTLKSMRFLHREAAIADSLCYTVFLVHKAKVKWYQSGFFKVFIIIVAIILIIIVATYGMANLATGLANFIVGGTASALTVFVTYVVLAFAIGSIISMAGQAIGGIWGTIFVVIAGIAMASSSSGSLTGSWGNAVNYINNASPYLLGGQKLYSHYVSDQLTKDWEQFLLTGREKQQQLEDAWADLNTPNWLDPLYLVRSSNYSTETPQNYLSRTKDANPGVTANTLIYNFATLARNLPENPMEKDLIQEMFIGFKKQSGAA